MSLIVGTTRPLQPVCSVVTTTAQLERLGSAWQNLLERSTSNEPVLSPLWLRNWWEVFGQREGRELHVYCFFREERLIGLAPLLRRWKWYGPGIPFRRLEALGTGERSAEAIHPDYVNILAERGAELEVVQGFVAALLGRGDEAAASVAGWDELVLPQMDGCSPLLPLLTSAFQERGLSCDCQITGSASYIPLPSSWEAYLSALSSSRRYYVRQSLRRFEQWAGNEACFHAVGEGADLEQGQRVLAALHQERWGDEDGKFGSPRFRAFHDRVLPALLEAEALELLWLTVRGEPIAAVYNILWNNKVYFYQSGRKPDVPNGQRPGIVLHAHAIRRAIHAGRCEYDFLGGGEHYKKQMALATRPIVQLRVARRNLRERTRVWAEGCFDAARAVRRRMRARWGRTCPTGAVGAIGERPSPVGGEEQGTD